MLLLTMPPRALSPAMAPQCERAPGKAFLHRASSSPEALGHRKNKVKQVVGLFQM